MPAIMRGNVWKFDMSSSASAATSGAWRTTVALYARRRAASTQPITGGVTISYDPVTEKRWVFFGTGRLLTTTDLTG